MIEYPDTIFLVDDGNTSTDPTKDYMDRYLNSLNVKLIRSDGIRIYGHSWV